MTTEQNIAQRIHEFDVHALLNLLHHIGYSPEEILFRSHLTTISPSSLLQRIEFLSVPFRRVVVTINLGLMGPNSPLPSYFFKMIDKLWNEKAFLDFISFFDHHLIREYVYSIYPEKNTDFYSHWEEYKRNHIRLFGVDCEVLLHRLFQLVFPELGVWVEKRQHRRQIKTSAIRLGEYVFNEKQSLGPYTTVPVLGFDITLYCDEEHDEKRTTWADKIARRLHTILFPVLHDEQIDIRVTLVIRSQKGWVQLKKGSYLGMDKIRGGTDKDRVVLIFNGQVPKGHSCSEETNHGM